MQVNHSEFEPQPSGGSRFDFIQFQSTAAGDGAASPRAALALMSSPATYCVEPTSMKLTHSIWASHVGAEPGSWQAAMSKTAPSVPTTLDAMHT